MIKHIKQIIAEKIANRATSLAVSIDSILNKKNYSFFIDITNGCNLRCTFCTRNNDKIVQMRTEDLERILDKSHKHISAIQLSCAWEYSIAKNAPEIIRTIGRYSIPSTTIYTNGNILTDDIVEALITSRVNDFVVSIGEAKKETYERLRRRGKFERVLANIKKLDRLKRAKKSRLPRICSNLTVVNSNIDELVDFVDLAHSIGIERIVGRHLILNEGLDMDDEKVRDHERVNNILDGAEKRAAGYGMSFSIPKYEDTVKPKQCRAPWSQLYISSNGDVSVCPRIHLYAKIGNFLTDSFKSIMNGSSMADLKKEFDNHSFSNPVCGICMDSLETERAINQGF